MDKTRPAAKQGAHICSSAPLCNDRYLHPLLHDRQTPPDTMITNNLKIIDLTQPLSETVPTWSGSCGFCLKMKQDYDHLFRVQEVEMQAGIGTHMDAPSHIIPGGKSIADLSLEELIVPICLIDVRDKEHRDYEISEEDLLDDEKKHGPISSHSLVIGYTGWSRFWQDSLAYRNLDQNGQMHFPAFSSKSADLLLKRNIAGLGIDTLSPDCLDQDFTVHRKILGQGKYIIENIGDCSGIPPRGSYAVALPLKMEAATESPIRIIALVDKEHVFGVDVLRQL